ncbi:MAG TPA: MBOAT family O-acyltransferase [Allosphingosinicella sp.]|jgi:D-alanyl-lipoteichoic acid acyltransferase DltB (MBOAT superfamily)
MAYHAAGYFLGFLPAVLLLYLVVRRAADGAATWFLLLASVAYYALADVGHLGLIAAATTFTYLIGRKIHAAPRGPLRSLLFAGGLFGNIALLAVWKLRFFGLGTGFLTTETVLLTQGLLPLGLSYLTLQQIAFLFAMEKRAAKPLPFASYALYVSFFPHIMLGPILRYEDAEEQYATLDRRRVGIAIIAAGLSLFTVGLAKKLLVGDRLAVIADPLFNAAAHGATLSAAEAWLAAWAYTLQLYFDFSGYSDMAIGGAMLFGLRMPINFFSPFKARTATDVFDRWHMSLVAFVRAYVFSPIFRAVRKRAPGTAATRATLAWAAATILSMTLVGWWHGSKATLVLSGFLIGVVAVAFPLLAARFRRGAAAGSPGRAGGIVARAVLLLGFMVFGIFFRADSLAAVGSMLASMAMPFSGPALTEAGASALASGLECLILLAATAIVFAAPNTCELFGLWDHPGAPARPPAVAGGRAFVWQPSLPWAAGLGVAAAAALVFSFAGRETASIYAAF